MPPIRTNGTATTGTHAPQANRVFGVPPLFDPAAGTTVIAPLGSGNG